jgi:hypothetical protein
VQLEKLGLGETGFFEKKIQLEPLGPFKLYFSPSGGSGGMELDCIF